MKNIIALGCDHAGFEYKEAVVTLLKERGLEIANKGTDSLASVDYPDFVHPVALDVQEGNVTCGIVMCGSGNGVAMTVNKHKGVRAALCWTTELAQLARLHNNANVLAIPVRFISQEVALDMIAAFLDTEFEGGRHQRRVGKINI